jgi:hypothetical protein
LAARIGIVPEMFHMLMEQGSMVHNVRIRNINGRNLDLLIRDVHDPKAMLIQTG